MEVLPCARVAHIERTKKPYNNDIDYYAKRNALRAAEVWMDEYKSHVYMAWNIPMNVSFSSVLDHSPPLNPQAPFTPSILFSLAHSDTPPGSLETLVNRNSKFRFHPA